MFGKLSALYDLFRVGESVKNPEAWKKGQITVTVLVPVIAAALNVAAAFGYVLPITTEQINYIAGAIVTGVNLVLTFTTTDKIGLPPKQ